MELLFYISYTTMGTTLYYLLLFRLIATIIEHILYAKHWTKSFTDVISFNSNNILASYHYLPFTDEEMESPTEQGNYSELNNSSPSLSDSKACDLNFHVKLPLFSETAFVQFTRSQWACLPALLQMNGIPRFIRVALFLPDLLQEERINNCHRTLQVLRENGIRT